MSSDGVCKFAWLLRLTSTRLLIAMSANAGLPGYGVMAVPAHRAGGMVKGGEWRPMTGGAGSLAYRADTSA